MESMTAAPVRTLYEQTNVRVSEGSPSKHLGGLSEATFKDQKWCNALGYLRANGLVTAEAVREILLEGAQAFGAWRLSEPALHALVAQVLEEANDRPSPGLQSWVEQSRDAMHQPLGRTTTLDLKQARTLTLGGEAQAEEDVRFRLAAAGGKSAKRLDALEDWVGVVDALTLARLKWGLATLLIVVSFSYACWVVFDKYAGILEVFAWPVILARAGGMGTALITGLLYLTMARTFMKQFYKFLGVNSKVLMILDGHKDVHVFLARCLGVVAAVHVLAHLLSTVPALEYGSTSQLNAIIACADREGKQGSWPALAWLQWPACPLTRPSMGWSVLVQSTPGVSGLGLVALLLLLGWTGRAKARSEKFDRFWYMHNLVIVAWPLVMFVHGSNQWIGVGFPLVAFTASVPMFLYAVDRVARLLRYYLHGGRAVRILGAVIRPGKGGGQAGALTHLTIAKPPGLWAFAPGMYAFICMPEYAPLQWHPFTICSGKSDEHVEFIIAGVGDWTQELAHRCLSAQQGQAALPKVALDGPFAAPAQSALSRPILVAVGAGVGITPFLSLMSSLISIIEESDSSSAMHLKEAHFFWMTRSVDEFLFGRKHFTRIASSRRLRQKVHLHLHTTAREPDGHGAAYLLRQAVKRQSRVDRAAFAHEFDPAKVLTVPQLPWCWVNSSQLDVMWLSDLTSAAGGEVEEGEEQQQQQQQQQQILWTLDSDGQSHGLEAAEEGRSMVVQQPLALTSRAASPAASRRARSPSALHSPHTSSPPCSPAGSPGPVSACSSPSARSRRKEPLSGTSWAQDLLHSHSRLTGRSKTALRTSSSIPESAAGAHALSQQADEFESEGDFVQGADKLLVPVAFGRPDFEAELRAIGTHWHSQEAVHVYICGNDAIVNGVKSTAETLNTEARSSAQGRRAGAQKYFVTYERFG